jgi:hypothetical protein
LWLENAESDQKVIKTAVKVWNKIVKEIDKIPLEVKAVPSEKGTDFKGLAFDLGVLFPEFKGLIVFFCGGLGSQASYSKSLNTIFINLLGDDSKFENDGESEKRIAALRINYWSRERGSSFIHEFVHYMDGQREGFVWPKLTKKYGEKESEYFNNPLEYNAFYQELIVKLNRTLKKQHFLKPFEEFIKIVRRQMEEYRSRYYDPSMPRWSQPPPEKWMDKLNPEYKQKFIKRIYQYYTMKRNSLL